jgi:hypothetical protein
LSRARSPTFEERDEELAAAREAHHRLMAEVNRTTR